VPPLRLILNPTTDPAEPPDPAKAHAALTRLAELLAKIDHDAASSAAQTDPHPDNAGRDHEQPRRHLRPL
jgi:hypothetical protein